MKYKMNSSQLNSVMSKYFDVTFQPEEINWTNPIEYNDDTGEEYEDLSRIEFYLGDYSDGETVFRWYDKDYWGNSSWKNYKINSPLLEVEKPYSDKLNGFFGSYWYEPFKRWFESKFGFSVNKIIDEI